MDNVTLDRALVYAVLQGGPEALFKARETGIRAEHFLAEDHAIWEFIESFSRKGRLPTTIEIAATTGVSLVVPEEPYDAETFAKPIARRALQNMMSDRFGDIGKLMVTDPFKAREEMASLVKDTTWSTGRLPSYTDQETFQEIIADYERAESGGGTLLGLSSPWPNVDEHSLGLQPGELTVVLAKRKTGKCLWGKTLCHDPVSGHELTIEDFVAEASRPVLTWGPNQSVHSVKPAAYVDTGTKECLKITWRSGRSLVATPEHPLMTPAGWARLDQMQEGHHTAAVAKLPGPLVPVSQPRHIIKILSYMLAEGGCSKPSTPTFTSNVDAIVGDMSAALIEIGCGLSPTRSRSGDYNVTISDGATRSPVVGLLKAHGLIKTKSIHKTIPDAIFSLPDEHLALFLGRLWSCDGTVEARGQVSYSTGSRKLADQVQHLLLRFGVTSRIRALTRKIKGGTEERDYYEVVLHRERIERFKVHIGPHFVGPKAEKIQRVTFQGRSRVGWIRNEEMWGAIRAEMEAHPELVSAVGEELGYQFRFQKSHVLNYKSGRIRKLVFAAFCEVYDSPLKWVLDDNIYWDEIVMVEPVGVKRVFDLTVLPTHCFIANDVIVHNTWILLSWFMHILKNDLAGTNDNLLIVSMEMPAKAIYKRLAAIDLQLDYKAFRKGRLTTEEKNRLLAKAKELENPPSGTPTIHVATAKEVKSVAEICDKVSELRPRAVGIDGMYILGRDKRMGMWERTITNCSEIKLDLCEDMDMGVLATTQIKGTTDKQALEATADDAAYAKAIGDWADAMRGLFMNDEHEMNGTRVFRAMESREFQGVDLEINFKLATHFSEVKIMDDKSSSDDDDEEKKKPADGEAEPVIDGSGGEEEKPVAPETEAAEDADAEEPEPGKEVEF